MSAKQFAINTFSAGPANGKTLQLKYIEGRFPDVEKNTRISKILVLSGCLCTSFGLAWSLVYLWFARYDLAALSSPP